VDTSPTSGIDRARPHVRLGLVLSAGGLRGAAHLGVLRQLVRHRVPIDTIIGVSAGAIVAGYYAAVGLDVDELIADAEGFRGRQLLAYSLTVHLGPRFERRLGAASGVIPDRLRQLDTASFDRLHHGIRRLGIVCHDLVSDQPCCFGTGLDTAVSLGDAVRASASIPFLFPPIEIADRGRRLRLTDGGLRESIPTSAARAFGATHLIVSDCRWLGGAPVTGADTVWIRPRLASTGTLWSPRRGLIAAVRNGEAAVSDGILSRIRSWLPDPARKAAVEPDGAGSL